MKKDRFSSVKKISYVKEFSFVERIDLDENWKIELVHNTVGSSAFSLIRRNKVDSKEYPILNLLIMKDYISTCSLFGIASNQADSINFKKVFESIKSDNDFDLFIKEKNKIARQVNYKDSELAYNMFISFDWTPTILKEWFLFNPISSLPATLYEQRSFIRENINKDLNELRSIRDSK